MMVSHLGQAQGTAMTFRTSGWRGLKLQFASALLLGGIITAAAFRSAAAQAINEPEQSHSATSRSVSLADLPALLRGQYPRVRAALVARDDCLLFEYYKASLDAGAALRVNSITKSVLSILIGIAIDKRLLRLDQKLSDLVPEISSHDLDARLRDISVRHLLTMTSGFSPGGLVESGIPITPHGMWRGILNRPIENAPGSHFLYDDQGAKLLSALLAEKIKQNEDSFARTYLFEPLGIKNYDWPSDAEGHLIGDGGLLLTARDMIKIGLLYLHKGQWNGKQLVSEDYVADSTAKHNDGGAPSHSAYGYLWWVGKTESGLDAFFAAGFGSQLIYVVPKLGVVVALASEASVAGGSVKFVNENILPTVVAAANAPACVNAVGNDQ